MRIERVGPGLLIGLFLVSVNLMASDTRSDFDAQLKRVGAQLNREAQDDVNGPMRMADLIQRQFGTDVDQIKWAVDHSVSWGDTVLLAYIRRRTGRTFERMTLDGAQRDFWTYADNVGMSADSMATMARSLESFLKTAEKERNSRIFERLRVSRRVQALPDLGSGFGLFQDALDFRQLNPPQPTKVHVVTGGLLKGEQ